MTDPTSQEKKKRPNSFLTSRMLISSGSGMCIDFWPYSSTKFITKNSSQLIDKYTVLLNYIYREESGEGATDGEPRVPGERRQQQDPYRSQGAQEAQGEHFSSNLWDLVPGFYFNLVRIWIHKFS